MSNYAWVTLATNDSYSLGALVVANSLKKVSTVHQTVVLITPGVSESMKSKLEATFNVVVEVNVLDSKDVANLALLSRPELGITFTKLHCWRLTQFEKCVFLDADTFVLQNCDELFDREELSAAPDVGWPDCFNSGVFVFRPSLDTFGKLIEFATRQGSFDGGDQGLLNSFFSDWATKDISKHLPFIYNTCSTACYSYLPAFKQFGQNVKILHFIGQVKPWLLNFDSSSRTAYAPQGFGHLGEYLQQWWNIFCADVHPDLTNEMTTRVRQQYSDEIQWYPNSEFLSSIPLYPNPPHIEYTDPWDTYYQTNNMHTDTESHCYNDANVDTIVLSSEDNHKFPYTPHKHVNNYEDHQHIHTESANVDLHHTTTEPHISIRSSSNDEIHVVESNSNFHQTCNQLGDDTSNHSININSFLTVNHVHSHANTTESPSISGNEIPKNGEQDRDSYQTPVVTLMTQNENYDGDVEDVNDDTIDTCEEGGLAGALSQLTLGAPRSAEQQAYEESMRRQCWEAGNIDYLGKDSFDNIWKRITKTIETKSDTPAPPTEKNRSPTPQPEELAVEEKKQVKVGPTLNESEEDDPTAQIHEQIVTEVTSDGRIIEKKIVTYPGEEITEIEEIEEVDGQTMSVKRTVVGSEKKAVQPKPKTLAEIKNEPVILVPGCRTVEIDEKTNTTTVTEKTTTGYQQTITTIQEDGTKKTQTKTFYDPVEIPGEEEEEVTYEEFETFEPENTTVRTITEAKDSVDCSVSKKDNEPEITEKENKADQHSTTVTEVADSTTSAKQTEAQQIQEQCSQQVKQQEETKNTKEEKDTTVTTADVKDLPLVLAAPAGPVSLTQKKTTTEGKEIEVTTTVSEDGKTKTLRKTVRQPSEEIEIEETEETESYEPGEVKVITTSKTIPLVDALEDAAKDIVELSKKVVDTTKTVVDSKNKDDATKIDAQQGSTSETSITEVQEQLKSKTKASVKQTTTAKQTVTPSKTTTEAKQTTTEAKQTMAEAKRTVTEAKQTPTEAKKSTTTATAKEELTSAKQTTIEAKQISTKAVTPGKPTAIKKDQTDASVKKTTSTKTTEKDTKNIVQPTTGKSTTTSKKDDSQNKSKTTTEVTKTESPVKSDKTSTKTSTSTEVATIGKPKVTTKNGETTTEVVRSIPGGTEHTLTTIKADGTKKVEIKKYFDAVELSGSEEEEEEYEEYEEVVEDETPPVKSTTTKIQTTTGAVGAKGPKTPTVTEATPPNTPPLKPLVIGGTSSDLNVEHEILDTPPLDKAEQLRKKKLQSAPASKVAQKVDKSAVEAPKPPPRKKEVKKPATGK